MVLAPALVGVISQKVGSVGIAVALLSLLNFLFLPVILLTLTENKGQTLEIISQPAQSPSNR